MRSKFILIILIFSLLLIVSPVKTIEIEKTDELQPEVDQMIFLEAFTVKDEKYYLTDRGTGEILVYDETHNLVDTYRPLEGNLFSIKHRQDKFYILESDFGDHSEKCEGSKNINKIHYLDETLEIEETIDFSGCDGYYYNAFQDEKGYWYFADTTGIFRYNENFSEREQIIETWEDWETNWGTRSLYKDKAGRWWIPIEKEVGEKYELKIYSQDWEKIDSKKMETDQVITDVRKKNSKLYLAKALNQKQARISIYEIKDMPEKGEINDSEVVDHKNTIKEINESIELEASLKPVKSEVYLERNISDEENISLNSGSEDLEILNHDTHIEGEKSYIEFETNIKSPKTSSYDIKIGVGDLEEKMELEVKGAECSHKGERLCVKKLDEEIEIRNKTDLEEHFKIENYGEEKFEKELTGNISSIGVLESDILEIGENKLEIQMKPNRTGYFSGKLKSNNLSIPLKVKSKVAGIEPDFEIKDVEYEENLLHGRTAEVNLTVSNTGIRQIEKVEAYSKSEETKIENLKRIDTGETETLTLKIKNITSPQNQISLISDTGSQKINREIRLDFILYRDYKSDMEELKKEIEEREYNKSTITTLENKTSEFEKLWNQGKLSEARIKYIEAKRIAEEHRSKTLWDRITSILIFF